MLLLNAFDMYVRSRLQNNKTKSKTKMDSTSNEVNQNIAFTLTHVLNESDKKLYA